MTFKVAKILANDLPNYPFTPKGNFFWKVDLNHFCLPSESHHPTTFQSNP